MCSSLFGMRRQHGQEAILLILGIKVYLGYFSFVTLSWLSLCLSHCRSNLRYGARTPWAVFVDVSVSFLLKLFMLLDASVHLLVRLPHRSVHRYWLVSLTHRKERRYSPTNMLHAFASLTKIPLLDALQQTNKQRQSEIESTPVDRGARELLET